MIKNRTYKQKCSASNWSGAKFLRLMRPFAAVQTMYTDLNISVPIKEDSP